MGLPRFRLVCRLLLSLRFVFSSISSKRNEMKDSRKSNGADCELFSFPFIHYIHEFQWLVVLLMFAFLCGAVRLVPPITAQPTNQSTTTNSSSCLWRPSPSTLVCFLLSSHSKEKKRKENKRVDWAPLLIRHSPIKTIHSIQLLK